MPSSFRSDPHYYYAQGEDGFVLHPSHDCRGIQSTQRRILPGCCSLRMTLCDSTQAFLQDNGMSHPVLFSELREEGWTVEDVETLARCYPGATEIRVVHAAMCTHFPSTAYVARRVRL